MSDPKVHHSGRHLEFRETDLGWEYVVRPGIKGCVAIYALTQENQVVLTEQYRPPVGRKVIELPAGLAGDIPLQEDEPLLTAARRELKEETGYEAKEWQTLWEGPSSAGLTTEVVTIFSATGLLKVAEGGGNRDEDIRVHLVEVSDLVSWCQDRQAEGLLVDFKIFTGAYLHRLKGGSAEGRLWY